MANGSIDDEAKNLVMNELKTSFRPEFLNRVDEIVMFKPLQRNEIFKIIDLLISDLETKVEDRQIKIYVTNDAKEYVLNRAYSSQYGARPVKRFIQKEFETKIGRLLIKGELKDKDTLVIDEVRNQLSLGIQK